MRLTPEFERLLRRAVKRNGRRRSEIVRDAQRRRLLGDEFEAFRRGVLPFAEARGYLTDEDVFRDVS